jgi:PleD family two-component response regulator
VSAWNPDEEKMSIQTILEEADNALYTAKRNGRNTVYVLEEGEYVERS